MASWTKRAYPTVGDLARAFAELSKTMGNLPVVMEDGLGAITLPQQPFLRELQFDDLIDANLPALESEAKAPKQTLHYYDKLAMGRRVVCLRPVPVGEELL